VIWSDLTAKLKWDVLLLLRMRLSCACANAGYGVVGAAQDSCSQYAAAVCVTCSELLALCSIHMCKQPVGAPVPTWSGAGCRERQGVRMCLLALGEEHSMHD
jgi:hypothetical protein